MKADAGAAIHVAEMLDLIGLVAGVEVKGDDSTAVLWSGHIHVAISTDGEVAYGAESFGHNGGVKAGRQNEAVRFSRKGRKVAKSENKSGGRKLHGIGPLESPGG